MVSGEAPHIPRMDLTADEAAKHGVPRDIEEWRLELVLALRNPDQYSWALRTVDNAALFASWARMEWITFNARNCIEKFVPAELEKSFHEDISDLRRRALAEAAARGINFVPSIVADRKAPTSSRSIN